MILGSTKTLSRGPVYIVLSGAPCAGKSTIATWLAKRWQLPVLDRDDIKDAIMHHFPHRRNLSRVWIRAVSYEILFSFLQSHFQQGKPFILESAFHPQEHNTILRRLQRQAGFSPLQIHCTAHFDILKRRHHHRLVSKHNHQGRFGRSPIFYRYRRRVLAGVYDPLKIGGQLLEVDTTNGWRPYRMAIVASVRKALAA